MDKRILAAALVLLAIGPAVAIAATPAAAQNANNTTATPSPSPSPTATATPEPTPPPVVNTGQYSYETLSYGGKTEDVDNVESVRALGSPNPKGFAALRYRDPTTFDAITGDPGKWAQAESGKTVRVNDLQLYGSAFGDASGDYELVMVFWQPRSPPNTTATFATNQSVYRHDVTFAEEDLYSYRNVSIPAHLDQTYRATAWLERGGERVDGAQWRFVHRSNPATQSVSINSESGLWGWGLRYIIIPGFIGVLVGFLAARAAVRQAGRGPGFGVGSWVMVTGFVLVIIGGVAWYQIAVLLNHFPMILGLSFGAIAFAIGLTHHQPVKTIAFMRRELDEAEIIPGGPTTRGDGSGMEVSDMGAEMFEEFTEALYVDLPEVPAVRTDDGYKVPVAGVRPFIARLFAEPALLDMSNIAVRTKVKKGRIDDIITVDPKAGDAVTHKPARYVRTLPWDTLGGDATGVQQVIAGIQTAMILFGPAALGFVVLGGSFNIPWVGAFIGFLVSIPLSHTAEDGWIDFTAAPPHYDRAEDSLTVLQRAYKVSAEEESAKKETYRLRSQTAAEARKEREVEKRSVTDEVLSRLGAGKTEGDQKALEPGDDETGGRPDDRRSYDGPDEDDDDDEDGNGGAPLM